MILAKCHRRFKLIWLLDLRLCLARATRLVYLMAHEWHQAQIRASADECGGTVVRIGHQAGQGAGAFAFDTLRLPEMAPRGRRALLRLISP